jgi:hypothetical protein
VPLNFGLKAVAWLGPKHLILGYATCVRPAPLARGRSADDVAAYCRQLASVRSMITGQHYGVCGCRDDLPFDE